MEKSIGLIILDYCRANNLSINSLAKALNLDTSGLYRSFRSKDIKVQCVRTISQISTILNHNFFIYFVQQSGSSEEQLLKLSTENRELSTKVASLQKEVDLLREINSLLKAKG